MLWSRWRLLALVVATSVAFACAAALLAPPRYTATGGVLTAGGMLKTQYAAADPQAAAALVQRFIDTQKGALLVDPPLVVREDLTAKVMLGIAVAALLLLSLLWRPRPPAAKSENDLINALGAPLLAARPLAAQDLSRQLLAHWFARGRTTLAIVSAQSGEGRTRVAAELARACAAEGVPTLVIDADFRSPALHRAFGLANRAGLADFLEGRSPHFVPCAENLWVLVAGRSGADPLELLSRGRMQELLAAAARRYGVVLVDTPAAARGPDLQLCAAFAGGALVVTRRPADTDGLKRLDQFLKRCPARVVGTVLSPA